MRLKVSPEIARIVTPGAPRDVQLAAAQGALPLAGRDLLIVLFLLCTSQDDAIKRAALKTLREVPSTILTSTLRDETLPPQLLDLLARVRSADADLMGAVILHPATTVKSLLYLAEKGSSAVLERLAGHQNLLSRNPQLVDGILANPAADRNLKFRLGWQAAETEQAADTGPEPDPQSTQDQEDAVESNQEDSLDAVDLNEGRSPTEIETLMAVADREGLSKFQIALELKVVEKIKMGLTGDKEWRSILLKESNRLVQGAVLKNPRITDGEVLMVAKNKTSSDEMIRIILLNKDWLKNYEIKKALVTHPKTPIPKALRFVSNLSTRDIKDLARSRQVSNIIATAARKELEFRIKKTGG